MTVRDATQTVQHEIGADGALEIRVPDASIRLRWVDGGVVRGEVRGGDADDLVLIDASNGRLTISAPDGRRGGFAVGLGLGFLGFGSDMHFEIELDVPRTARVTVETASGEIRGEGVTGKQRYRTASGEIDLGSAAGTIEMDAVSGGIRVSGPGPLKIRARTISGDAELETGTFHGLDLSSTSGDVRLRGEFQQNGEHRLSTVSGDTDLDLAGPLRVEANTMTGDVIADASHRAEGGPGRRALVIGKDGATLYFKSVSGDLRITSRTDTVARHESQDTASQPPNLDRIAILEGVERGEISVTEASRWLELLGDEG